jgi:WD40 repeat protein
MTLKLWDAELGKELATLKGHTRSVDSCAFSPDGRRIVSGSYDKTLKLWDGESGEEISTLKGHTDRVTACAFSPDGRHIISASDDMTLKLWDAELGKQLATFKGHPHSVDACAFSPDGKRIVFGDREGQVLLVAIENVEMLAPVVTTVRIRLFRGESERHHWDDSITTTCRCCGKRFAVSDEILNIIKAINPNARISHNQSPYLELPDEAWDEPRLLSECPFCHKPLRFNPFIVDNRDRY